MEILRPSLLWRLVSLFVILLNVSFGYIYPFLPLGLEDMRTASAHYPNLFTPAPYAFTIWGLIYGSWLVYAVYALLPSQRRNPLHDRMSRLLILVNILATLWIVEFAAGFLTLSQIVILAMLGTGIWMYRRVRNGTHSGLQRFPFSVFLGWITVATLANLNAVLVSYDWHGGSLGEPAWTMILITVALFAGLITGVRFRDRVYPLVIAWAVTAIGVKTRLDSPEVSMAAFGSAIVLASLAVYLTFRSNPRPGRA